MIENPDSPGQPTFRPQFPIRSADMREMWEQSRRAGRAAAWGNDGDNNAAGFQVPFDLAPVGFWARLASSSLSSSQALYSWVEVQDDGTGSGWTPPNDPNSGTQTAFEVNENTGIIVPGPPTSLSASLAAGGALTVSTQYFWVVTANWTNIATGASLQSYLSSEVHLTPTTGNQSATLTWTAPAAATGFTLSGYSVWRGTSAGGENVLVAGAVGAGATSYTDTGSAGTSQSPILGGTAGPVVWLSPLATAGFWKFVYPFLSIGGVNLQSGTSYTFAPSDYSKLVSFSNAAAIAATLPQATTTGFGSLFFMDVENRGTGTLTITPAISAIDGVASLALTTNQGVRIFSDGANYYTQRGMGSGSSSQTPLGVRLSSNFVMAVNSTAQNVTGMTLTLSSAGKYIIWGQISAVVNVASLASQELSAYLTYSPAPGVTPLSNACIVKSVQTTTLGNGGVDGTGVLNAYVQVTGSTTVQLVVQMNSASFTAASILGSTTGNSLGTVLTALGPF